MNLILMLGPVTFLLALLGPLLILLVFLLPSLCPSDIKVSYKLLIFLSPALLWLAIMFSRPHKVFLPALPWPTFLSHEPTLHQLSRKSGSCIQSIHSLLQLLLPLSRFSWRHMTPSSLISSPPPPPPPLLLLLLPLSSLSRNLNPHSVNLAPGFFSP
jgi:hypothetical protein